MPNSSAPICKINPIAKNKYALDKKLLNKIPKIKCIIASPIEINNK